jgi:predicted nucleic acid-binding protein
MKYFIDTNIIIDFLNGGNKANEILVKIANEPNSELYINRLICLESLRTIHFTSTNIFQKAKDTLESFEKLEINPEIYMSAIHFSRFCHSKGVKLKGKCEAIDFLHFITAKHYDLKIITYDNDMQKLEDAYQEFPIPPTY